MAQTEPYGKSEYNNSYGIKRIALKESAIVEILRIESPSSLFVRHKDHIRDQLVYKEPYELNRIKTIQKGTFALAPIMERAFGRCVVLNHFQTHHACRVFFIDDAVVSDVAESCLFEIEESQVHYPWQVMHITLGRLTSLTPDGSWTPQQCEQFCEVLSNFDRFEITPSQVDLDTHSDRPSLLVNLYGLEDGTLEKKVCIEEMCGSLMNDTMVSMFPMNLMEDPKLERVATTLSISIEEFRRAPPENWIHETEINLELEDSYWSLENCQVSEWNAHCLEKYQEEDGYFVGTFYSNPSESPTEMYIVPVLPENIQEEKDENWVCAGVGNAMKLQLDIDNFYSLSHNQRPLEMKEIEEALDNGRKIYAIAENHHEKRGGSSWNRCEIIAKLNDNTLTIRSFDLGKRGNEKLKNLFRIHKSHTCHIPFVLEIGKSWPIIVESDSNGKATRYEQKWTEEELNAWKEDFPYDQLVVVKPKSFEGGRLEIDELYLFGEPNNMLDLPKKHHRSYN